MRALRDAVARHPAAADAALAATLAVAALVSVSATFELLRQDPSLPPPERTPIVVATLLVIAPLALRRRLPLGAAVVVVGAFVAGRVLVDPGIPGVPAWESTITVYACWIALYSAVAHGRGARRALAVGVALAGALLAEVVRELVFEHGGILPGLPLNEGLLLVYNAAAIVFPIALAAAVRASRADRRALAAQAVELAREREANARRAVLEERVRIARELHDVVAHHVSVMGIQAGAARRVMERRPEQAAVALAGIEESSRSAVLELQRLLGVLRRDGQPDDLAPQPDLARLPELVAEAGAAGLAVELAIEGEPRPLPGTIELSAYRIVQEALTNARKHSGGRRATVRIGYGDDALELEVVDDGRARVRAGRAAGHGLIGMRERASLHGGQLRAGPCPGGGFAVRARLPLEGRA